MKRQDIELTIAQRAAQFAEGSIRAQLLPSGGLELLAPMKSSRSKRPTIVVLTAGQVRTLVRWLTPTVDPAATVQIHSFSICQTRPDYLTRLPKIRRKARKS